MIGVIAGVGPFAGLDLLAKILAQTRAQADQDHLPVISLSHPSTIPDRSAFLLGETNTNPAWPILDQLLRLEQSGAEVAGVPCNTAHAPPIMDVIQHGLAASGSRLRLIHMIAEVGHVLQRHFPGVHRVGVLSTLGTYSAHVYPGALEPLGFKVVEVDKRLIKEKIQPAIYDAQYGIKSCGYATDRAHEDLNEGIKCLRVKDAQVIVLGCTELPLAFRGQEVDGLPLIDSTMILARSLIHAVDPTKLLPWRG